MSAASPTFAEAIRPLLIWVLGPDRATRLRVVGVGLCFVMYMLSCVAAQVAVQGGLMKAWAVPVLVGVTLPANALVLVLVRSGWSRRLKDPTLMLPQNVLALAAITLAYVAIAPGDRGLVFLLLTLVMVFGMYTHTPSQTLAVGGGGVAVLGVVMVVLAQVDPAYYPAAQELLRFELLLGCMPVLAYTAFQLARWRERLRLQRDDLHKALARVQELATRDVVTGLVNRRHMQDRLADAVKRLERYGECFTLALIDLDHFKRINDQHGHHVGDEVLKAFAEAASAVLRDSDTLARWGGEEFLVLFPDTDPEQAQHPLLRLRQDLRGRSVSVEHPDLRITFSAGLTQHVARATLDHSLERADTALYEAKRAGRDQLVQAPLLPGADAVIDDRVL